MTGRVRSRRGYTLVEVLGYGTILAVLMNLSTSVFIGTKRLHTLSTLALERSEVLDEIERDFRNAVRVSDRIGAPPAELPAALGPVALVTEIEGGTHYSVWREEASGRLCLEKYDAASDGKVTLVWRKAYSECIEVSALHLGEDAGLPRLVHLDLTVNTADTPKTVPAANRFTARMVGP